MDSILVQGIMSSSQQLTAVVLNFKKTTKKSCLSCGFPLSLSTLREESDLKKKHIGVCTKKKTWIFIFHCQLHRKSFSTICMRLFFFNRMYQGIRLKCTVTEKEQKKLVYLSHNYLVFLSILRLSAAAFVSQGGNPRRLVNSSSLMYISGRLITREVWIYKQCGFFPRWPYLSGI